jgi:hypothetical protein
MHPTLDHMCSIHTHSCIRSVVTKNAIDLGGLNHKGWGMGADLEVWWACADNILSFSPKNRVVIDRAEWPSVGFSCLDRPAFFRALNQLLGYEPNTPSLAYKRVHPQ